MSLMTSRELAQDEEFRNRVRVAAVTAAVEVAAEEAGTPNHERRIQLATQVLRSPDRWGEMLAEGVAVNPSIVVTAGAGGEVSDSDIQYTVNSLWNAYAGSDG